MTRHLRRLTEALALEGMTLRRSWPSGDGRLALDVDVDADARGRPLAGQWHADVERAAHVAGQTRHVAGSPGDVTLLAESGIVLQGNGADRRLTALSPFAAAPGSTLVVHRAEKRGVVRQVGDDGSATYTKIVRPERSAALADAARSAAGSGLRVPTVVATDLTRGLLTTAELAGRPWHEMLADERVSAAQVAAAARETGSVLARLHAMPVGDEAAAHDPAREHAVTQEWLRHATAYGVLPPAVAADTDGLLHRLRTLLADAPGRLVPVHRDLHDKQVLVDPAEGIGMLDFDLAAAGEPALDLANLLVHLELRVRQGHTTEARGRACADALLDGYRPDAEVRRRLPAYALSTRLRLVAVYGFRPPYAGTVSGLLGDEP